MPRYSPLTPIFDPPIRRGSIILGNSPGSIGAAPSAGVVTVPASILAPTVTAVSFDPILDIGWHAAYWANGPEMMAIGYTNGALVSPWPDEIGTEDMTGSQKPAYVTSDANFNSKRTVSFDGASDHRLEWLNASNPSTQAQPIARVVIGRFSDVTNPSPVGNATGPCMFDGGGPTAAGAEPRLRLSAPSGTTLWAMVAGGTEVKSGTADTNPHCFMAYYNGASSRLEVDGTSVLTGNPGGAGDDGISVGYANGAASTNWRFRGQIAFLGIYFGDPETAPRWGDFKTWIGTYYGITVA